MPDKNIDYSDIAEVDDEMFAQGELVLPDPKETITIRLDKDVLTWFRGRGKGYQTRINAVLRRYMTAQKNSPR
jgi:uncharacterized protein (DUF4415 family)